MLRVIGAFDDGDRARRAVDRLLQSGFDRQDVHVEQHDPSDERSTTHERGAAGISGFFARLLGGEDQANTGHAHTYEEAVRRGSCVVVVDAQDERQADEAASCLHELGAVDVDERAVQWRSDGRAGAAAPATGERTGTMPEPEGARDLAQQRNASRHSLDRGGVRVVPRGTGQPLRELLGQRTGRSMPQPDESMDTGARGQDLRGGRMEDASRSALSRERATAADYGEPPVTGRDPEAGSGGTTRPRKDEPPR